MQKTIVRTSFIMSTLARNREGYIVQAIIMPIHKFNPIVRLRGIIFVNTKYHYVDIAF